MYSAIRKKVTQYHRRYGKLSNIADNVLKQSRIKTEFAWQLDSNMNVKLILNLFAFCEAVAPLESLKELVKLRVEHFATFEKLVFAITIRISRSLMKHIDKIFSLESKHFPITIQGCWANSDDGNRQKVVRISPTMWI